MPLPYAGDKDSGLASAVKSRTAHVVHLTHNDLDAVGADAVHRMVFGSEGVFTVWSSVGKFFPLFTLVASCEGKGDLLSISDLGYHSEIESIAVKAKKNGWKVEWRDHHRWRDEEVKNVGQVVDLLHIDTSVCGTGIVARDIAPENPVAADVARVVCDYDLWKHADPRSAVLGQVLQRKENRDHVRDCLIQGIFSDAH
ncbi:MAG: phosphoesterase, partial [Methanoregula sp.]|nr:phosphoesterase [Methanoregula sp.]